MNEITFTIDQLPEVVDQVMQSCKGTQIITLQGTLGAGKTTLAIQFLKACGIQGEMQSPTYTYMQMYKNDAGKNFYHFDLYRLQNKDAFWFAGFDEFLYQPNSLVIIEWPEIIAEILDRNVCVIQLEYVDNLRRKIIWKLK